MAESWGKRFMRRSAWVPLPTPGAPTRIMRAARLSSLVVIVGDWWGVEGVGEGVPGVTEVMVVSRRGGKGEARGFGVVGYSLMVGLGGDVSKCV